MRIAPILFLSLIIFSCQKNVRPTAAGNTPSTGSSTSGEPSATSGLIFLNFKAKANGSASIISLISQKIVPGSKKKARSQPRTNYLVVQLVTSTDQILQSDTTDHPLIRDVEFMNDKNAFERKVVTLEEADFSVRMTYIPTAQLAKVTEVREQKIVGSTRFTLK